MLNFVKCFFCIYWDEHVSFFCLLFCWYGINCGIDTLIDLHMLSYYCDCGINSTWLPCMNFLMYWIWFINILFGFMLYMHFVNIVSHVYKQFRYIWPVYKQIRNMASPTQWTWVWASPWNWWWTEKPGMLQSMGLQRVRHDWATELNQYIYLVYMV